jgi:hypothetical protein
MIFAHHQEDFDFDWMQKQDDVLQRLLHSLQACETLLSQSEEQIELQTCAALACIKI